MQVRSLTVKTTEILQLELAIREQAEALIDEIDALVFSVEGFDFSETQAKALQMRVNTLSQISYLLPERDSVVPRTQKLKATVEAWTHEPSDGALRNVSRYLDPLRTLFNPTPTISRVEKQPVSATHLPVPDHKTQRPDKQPISTIPAKETPSGDIDRLKQVRHSLCTEFGSTTDALRDLLVSAEIGTERNNLRLFQAKDLLAHAQHIFEDMSQTALGFLPKDRPHLNRITCLTFKLQNRAFAIPERAILKALGPGENLHGAEHWDVPGGTFLKCDGQSIRKITLHEALGLDAKQEDKAPPQLLISTSRGPFLLPIESQGDFVPLVPDLGVPHLSSLGPYLGAAIMPKENLFQTSDVIIVLDPEKIALRVTGSPSHTEQRKTLQSFQPSEKQKSTSKTCLIGTTLHGRLISLPMDQVSHVELIPVIEVTSSGGQKAIRSGTSWIRTIDADEIISRKNAQISDHLEYFQAVITREESGPRALLLREVIGQCQEDNLTDFGFPQRPGVRGAALCDEQVVCALDVTALPLSFSHFA